MDNTNTSSINLQPDGEGDGTNPAIMNHPVSQQTEVVTTSFQDVVTPTVMMESGSMSVPVTVGDKSGGLAKFLGRPVLIDTDAWLSTDAINHEVFSVNVVADWLANARVREKIKNYAKFRAKFHVRIQCSSAPAYYGLLCVGCVPQGNNLTPTGTTQYWHKPDSVGQLSQTMCQYIDASKANTIEFELGWIYPSEFMDITSAGLADRDAQEMWDVNAMVVAPLSHAQDYTQSIQVGLTMYVWATDIQLIIPYSYQMQKAKPSGMLGSLSRGLAAMGDVPIVGSGVKAASEVASGLSTALEWFGYTAEPDNSPFSRIRPLGLGYMATTNVQDPAVQVSLMSDTQLGVSPSISTETEVDEMAFSTLAKIETLVDTFAWSTTQVSGTTLYDLTLGPMITSIMNGSVTHLTPLGMVGTQFQYWRGGFKVKVQVVASPFHRGRIQAVYYPGAPVGSEDPTGVSYSTFLDCTNNTSVIIHIPYATGEFVKMTGGPYNPNVAFDSEEHAGVLRFRVVNPLLVSDPAAQIRVALSVWFDDDFQFAGPDAYWFNNWGFQMQKNGEIVGGNEVLTPPTEVCLFAEDGYTDLDIAPITGADKIRSIAALVQKYAFDSEIFLRPDATVTPTNNRLVLYSSVTIRPWASNRVNNVNRLYSDTLGTVVNHVQPSPMSMLQGMYLGSRGGQRLKIVNHNGMGDTSKLNGNDFPVTVREIIVGHNVRPRAGFVSTGTLNNLDSTWGVPSTAQSFPQIGNSSTVEVAFPYYEAEKYHINRFEPVGAPPTAIERSYNFMALFTRDGDISGATTLNIQNLPIGPMYRAGASDFRFVKFRFVPGLVIYAPT